MNSNTTWCCCARLNVVFCSHHMSVTQGLGCQSSTAVLICVNDPSCICVWFSAFPVRSCHVSPFLFPCWFCHGYIYLFILYIFVT